MIRLLLTVLLSLVANAIGLLVAAAVLDDMTLDAGAFVIEVALFTLVVFGLTVTSLVTDGLRIRRPSRPLSTRPNRRESA